MKSIKRYLVGLGVVLGFGLMGCEGTADSAQLAAELLDDEGPSWGQDGAGAPRVVSLMKANSQDITDHRVECRGKDAGKVCVEICHRPPGNPANSKTMILPLPAVFAHLKHGNSTQPDTLGSCEFSEGGGAHPGEGDPGDGYPGEGDHEDENDDGEDEGDLPVWCEENLDIDADCDGFDDGPFPEPIY